MCTRAFPSMCSEVSPSKCTQVLPSRAPTPAFATPATSGLVSCGVCDGSQCPSTHYMCSTNFPAQVTSADDLGAVTIEAMLPGGLEPVDPLLGNTASLPMCAMSGLEQATSWRSPWGWPSCPTQVCLLILSLPGLRGCSCPPKQVCRCRGCSCPTQVFKCLCTQVAFLPTQLAFLPYTSV